MQKTQNHINHLLRTVSPPWGRRACMYLMWDSLQMPQWPYTTKADWTSPQLREPGGSRRRLQLEKMTLLSENPTRLENDEHFWGIKLTENTCPKTLDEKRLTENAWRKTLDEKHLTASCTASVLSHRTGRAPELPGHQLAVVPYRDGQLYCICTKP